MSLEKLIKRTIHIAKCVCGWQDVRESNPPKEVMCPKCRIWIPFKEESYTGPEITP